MIFFAEPSYLLFEMTTRIQEYVKNTELEGAQISAAFARRQHYFPILRQFVGLNSPRNDATFLVSTNVLCSPSFYARQRIVLERVAY